jgi:hypothetical protein
MKVHKAGEALNATFSLENVTPKTAELVMHARGGNGLNSEYAEGLELLVARLSELGATITSAAVESKTTAGLPEFELPPTGRAITATEVPLTGVVPKSVRLTMQSFAAKVGRPKGAKGSGNNTKRIRIKLALKGGGTVLAAKLEGKA